MGGLRRLKLIEAAMSIHSIVRVKLARRKIERHKQFTLLLRLQFLFFCCFLIPEFLINA